jgi:hypothetical protein
MKISARNFLEGKIKEVSKGATTAHVEIELKGGETVILFDHQRSGRGARSQKRHPSLRGHQSLRCDDRYKVRERQAKFVRATLPFAIPFRSSAGYKRSVAIPPLWS